MAGKLIEQYTATLPANRRERILQIHNAFTQATNGLQLTLDFKMPTYQKNGNVVCVGNQKHHVSVYFCAEELIMPIKVKHPHINTGKGCVRIKDSQELPLNDLIKCFKKAMTFKKAVKS